VPQRIGWLLVVLAVFILPRPAAAELDPETKKPYRLRVVLHAEEHRALTPVFKGQLERELGGLLRNSFGPLVEVQVEQWDAAGQPILKEIERRGLGQALESWDNPLPGKTHFLLLRFAADRYEIQSRQHDHLTGLCTGAVRRAEVTDPRLVARAAAELVEQDFGVVATVTNVSGRDVEVAVKGGELPGVSLKRWIAPGDVLRVVRVVKDKERGEPLDWVLLRVSKELKDGRYLCRLFNRYEGDDLGEPAGVLGYRCLRVSAGPGRVRLRLVDEKTGRPLDGLVVRVRRSDFAEGRAEDLVTPASGLVVSGEVYDKAAFAQVVVNGDPKAQLPVLLLDDRPVVCPLGVIDDPQAERQALLKSRRDFWERRILDGLRAANERVRALNQEQQKSPEQTLLLAGKAHNALKADLENLGAEHKALRAADAKLDLHDGERLLAVLKQRGGELNTYIEGLDKALKEKTGEKAKALKANYERARLLETQADYQEALNLYEAILKDNPQETNVKADRDRLAAAWAIKSPAHEQARKYVYEEWPKVDLAGLPEHLKKARAALAELRKAGDRLTPRKILLTSVPLFTQLKNRQTAQRLDTEDGRAESQRLIRLGQEFRDFLREVTAYLGKE
jgi:hypothetical protein